jgi:hypothetical protein
MDTPSDRLRPRGTRPDAETSEKIYLLKRVSTLRATYQVRLLLFHAAQQGKKLVLVVPPACQFDDALRELLRARAATAEREDLA